MSLFEVFGPRCARICGEQSGVPIESAISTPAVTGGPAPSGCGHLHMDRFIPCGQARVRLPGADGVLRSFRAKRTLRLRRTPERLVFQDSGAEQVGCVVADPVLPVRRALALGGEWAGWLSYDVGRFIEPVAATRGAEAANLDAWPLIELHELQPVDGERDVQLNPQSFVRGPLVSQWGASEYQRGVARVLELVRDGDCYQVNLAHQLSADFEGSPAAIFDTLIAKAVPPHAMYVESPPVVGEPRRAMLSLSPELFLEYDASRRRVITRPMKGTRPCIPGAHEELEASDKDRAELAMIVDLMRNDLGRVCEVGSVRVDVPRRIERHDNAAGGVWQAIAQVSGTMRGDLGLADLITATFPAGSVTGAPKIRAMQIIDELEPVRRGVYCGSGIHIRTDGSATLNVAIRTALLETDRPIASDCDQQFTRGTLRYSVGAGIVADSQPVSEWQETLVKAGAIRSLSTGAEFDSA